MLKKISLLFTLILVLGLFAGCGEDLASMERKLDRMEDRAENYLEEKEDKAEQYVESAGDSLKNKATNGGNALTEGTGSPNASRTAITEEEAEDVALQYAGVSREEVRALRSEYEVDDGVPQYDVEFHKDGWEYEFEIHGESGEIISYDKDPGE